MEELVLSVESLEISLLRNRSCFVIDQEFDTYEPHPV